MKMIYVTYYHVDDKVWLMDAFQSRGDAGEAIESYPGNPDCYVVKEVPLW